MHICTLCANDSSVSHGGRNDIAKHVKGKHHQKMAQVSSSSMNITSFYNNH